MGLTKNWGSVSVEGEIGIKGQLGVSATWSSFPYHNYKVNETQRMD